MKFPCVISPVVHTWALHLWTELQVHRLKLIPATTDKHWCDLCINSVHFEIDINLIKEMHNKNRWKTQMTNNSLLISVTSRNDYCFHWECRCSRSSLFFQWFKISNVFSEARSSKKKHFCCYLFCMTKFRSPNSF